MVSLFEEQNFLNLYCQLQRGATIKIIFQQSLYATMLSHNQGIVYCDMGEKGKERGWMKGLFKTGMKEEEMEGCKNTTIDNKTMEEGGAADNNT